MPSKKNQRDDYDGAWKEAIETYLRDFLDLFFAEASAGIDWSCGYRFLDKELQKITPRGALRKGVVDKLFEAYSIDGAGHLLAVHLETQNEPIDNLPERVFQYHYRIYDRLNRPVASLALLTDAQPDWRPNRFERVTLGCKIILEFPVAKLNDFATPEIIDSPNPFSLIIRAHIRARASKRDPHKRYDLRMALMEEVAERVKDNEAEAERLFGVIKFIEYVMQLPEDMEDKFYNEYKSRHEGEKVFVTSFERRGRAEGRAEGRVEGRAQSVIDVLTARFGQLPETLNESVKRITDVAALESLIKIAATCAAIGEFEQALAATANDSK